MNTFALLATLLASLQAVPAGSATQAVPPRILLATYGPGDAVWEKFGHNAIWVVDPVSGRGVSYNWGMFSFDQPGFVPRLMRGSMLYWMLGQDAAAEAGHYVQSGRSIRLQELNLSAEEKAWIVEYLDWNDRDENRFYDYDYFRDNCSTRIRDVLDRALGGELQRTLPNRVTRATFRSESLRLTADAPAAFTGLELGMGDAVDRPLSEWELTFVPMRLADAIAGLQRDGGGALVASDTVLFTGPRGFGAAAAPDRTLPYLLVGLLIAALLAGSAAFARRGGAAVIPFALLGGAWYLAVGFFGLLLALLWGFTGHIVTYYNENLLQANPLALAMVLLAPVAAFGYPWARRAGLLLAAALTAFSVLGLLLQVLPGFDQYNRHILALLVPTHAGGLLALYLLRDARRPYPETAGPGASV